MQTVEAAGAATVSTKFLLSTVLTGATAGVAGAELWQIIVVGLVGGVVGYMKRYNHSAFLANKVKTIMAIPFSITVPAALTALVYYFGTDCVNNCVKDMGTMVWTFAAFLSALYYDEVLPMLALLLPGIAEKFGIKIKKEEPMSDYEEEGEDDV